MDLKNQAKMWLRPEKERDSSIADQSDHKSIKIRESNFKSTHLSGESNYSTPNSRKYTRIVQFNFCYPATLLCLKYKGLHKWRTSSIHIFSIKNTKGTIMQVKACVFLFYDELNNSWNILICSFYLYRTQNNTMIFSAALKNSLGIKLSTTVTRWNSREL
jgi:hypothetical protein